MPTTDAYDRFSPRRRAHRPAARLLATAVALCTAICAALALATPTPSASAAPVDLAAGRPAAASSHTQGYVAGRVTDGDPGTYWESANRALPQWVQVDLGASARVESLSLSLPPSWEARTQTLAVSAGTDAGSLRPLVAEADYRFAPGSQNTVTIDVPDTSASVVRLTVSANTGWPAGQLSELRVLGTRDGPTVPGPDPTAVELARGQAVSASSHQFDLVARNANDGDRRTYWEGAGGQYPATLTTELRVVASRLDRVVVELNPDAVWGPRTQTFAVLGRASGASGFTTLTASAEYAFSPSTGNRVSVPVVGTDIAEVRLRFTGNTGAGNGQVAELQVYGVPAATPDLRVSGLVVSPSQPTEATALELSATVHNDGTGSAPASQLRFTVGETTVTAQVGALAAGASTTVRGSIPAQPAGTYPVTATADPGGTVRELDEGNNTARADVTVAAVASADLVPVLTWNPSTPSRGQTVTFSVVLRNEGTRPSSSDPHGVTVVLLDSQGREVRRLTGSVSGAIAAGASSAPLTVGTWTASDGGYTVRATVADDANELPARRANNTATTSLVIGRGASMPYTTVEAESGSVGGGASVVGPNRTVGDVAGEASGRRAVVLDSTGEYVQWTTPVATNTLVARFSMPDGAGGGGISSSINLYVDGRFVRSIDLTSRFAWQYGQEDQPTNNPGSGGPRHIYDEASVLLDSTIAEGSTIRLQKDASNSAAYYAIDFVDLEVATPVSNPDPARYVVPAGFGQQDVQNAINSVIQDSSKVGVYLPRGTYQTTSKFQVYGKAMTITGAGPWFTRFTPPASAQPNQDIGFNAQSSASGSTFRNFSYFGNYVTRIDGPGKVFDFTRVSDMTVDNIWVEHMICMFWASDMDNSVVQNSRIRNTFADAINMTNGSSGNRVRNNAARGTGDDSFALFAATDNGGTGQRGNVFENLTSTLTWRAAGVAVYGGQGNTFRNIYVADTLVYPGLTISSLDFGYPMEDFGPTPTVFDGITLVRAGGHFYGQQAFPALWLFSADKRFRNIEVRNVDIVDPTYQGIMFQTKYTGGQPENPFESTTLENISISGAHRSGDAWNAKSGIGIWVNEMPETGQGPAVGSAQITNLRLSDNAEDIRNRTTTFRLDIRP